MDQIKNSQFHPFVVYLWRIVHMCGTWCINNWKWQNCLHVIYSSLGMINFPPSETHINEKPLLLPLALETVKTELDQEGSYCRDDFRLREDWTQPNYFQILILKCWNVVQSRIILNFVGLRSPCCLEIYVGAFFCRALALLFGRTWRRRRLWISQTLQMI